MDNKDFVPCGTARKLKAAGFDYPCSYYYTGENAPKGHIWRTQSGDPANFNVIVVESPIKCSAPTLWQAAKWLREECGLHIDVGIYTDCANDADGEVCDRWDFWGFDIYEVTGGKRLTDDDSEYDSYEAALSAGIDAALDLIINKTE